MLQLIHEDALRGRTTHAGTRTTVAIVKPPPLQRCATRRVLLADRVLHALLGVGVVALSPLALLEELRLGLEEARLEHRPAAL